MPRRVTLDDLTAGGMSEAKAKLVLKELEKPKLRKIFWQFSATEKEAIKVAEAFPDLEFARRYKPRASK